jgi:hypothetical protein
MRIHAIEEVNIVGEEMGAFQAVVIDTYNTQLLYR